MDTCVNGWPALTQPCMLCIIADIISQLMVIALTWEFVFDDWLISSNSDFIKEYNQIIFISFEIKSAELNYIFC